MIEYHDKHRNPIYGMAKGYFGDNLFNGVITLCGRVTVNLIYLANVMQIKVKAYSHDPFTVLNFHY